MWMTQDIFRKEADEIRDCIKGGAIDDAASRLAKIGGEISEELRVAQNAMRLSDSLIVGPQIKSRYVLLSGQARELDDIRAQLSSLSGNESGNNGQ
ncbi:MAG: hypothetical protein J4432_04445 [DPANN group archaeon]|nr:hypothetical protein [DPANN group archaeon]